MKRFEKPVMTVEKIYSETIMVVENNSVILETPDEGQD